MRILPPHRGTRTGSYLASQAAVETCQVATDHAVLHSLYVVNVGSTKRYVWVFEGTNSSGPVLAGPYPVEAGGFVSAHFRFGIKAQNGIHVALSSTPGIFTAAGASEMRVNAGFTLDSDR